MVLTALNSTTGHGPTVKTNSQKAKKGLPHGELQRIVNFQGVPNGILSCMLLSYYGLETRAWKTEGPRPTPDIARSVVEAFEVLYLLAVDPAPPPEVPLPADPATPSMFNTCPSSTVMVCTDEPLVGWI